MKARKPFIIAGQRIRLGESRTIEVKFSESYLGSSVTMPVRVIRAKESGPTLLLTATIHGDELNGMGILRELLYGSPPRLTRGTLVCVPVVNVYGLENHTRYLPDRRDLNRCFPGSTAGSTSSRLAAHLFNEIVTHCDYCVDFHTAAIRRTNYPNIRADLSNAGARMLARAFGCELIVDGKGPEGSLRRTATEAGIPTIILEAGEIWKVESVVVQLGVRGVLNVLKTLGMVRGNALPPRYQTKIRKTIWVRAQRGGSLGFNANPGELIAKDQPLATNYSIFGAEWNQLLSPTDGIVLGMTTMPVVKPGDPVYNIACISRTTYNRIKKRIDASSSRTLFDRIQHDLATNVHSLNS